MTVDTPNQTLVESCYKVLKEGIIRGEFAPRQKLRISKLTSILNVGPTPIREALSRLTYSGLVVAESNKGFFVKEVSEGEVRDLYATFHTIELLALQSAIDQGDTDWEANIVASLYQLGTIENTSFPIDTHLWLKLNYQFHRALIAACNSPCLLKIREDLYHQFDRYCQLSILAQQDSLHVNHQDHCDIAHAVISRDKETACHLITIHFQTSLVEVIKELKKSGVLDE